MTIFRCEMDRLRESEKIRKEHFNLLKSTYYEQYDSINKLLFITEKIVHGLDTKDDAQRIYGLILAKGINLFKSSYSTVLDGNGQEAGALLRVLVEAIELLEYLRVDEQRFKEFIDDELPSAGRIAKTIDGDFHRLRNHLNDNACHFSRKKDSMAHLIDKNNGKLILYRRPKENTLITNINMIAVFGYFLLQEALLALNKHISIDHSLVKKLEICRKNIMEFAPEMYV